MCAGSTLPKVSGDIKEWRWGARVEKAKQYTLKASAPERDIHSLTFKKMEPRPYFNIKNALNGFTYNLVPEIIRKCNRFVSYLSAW